MPYNCGLFPDLNSNAVLECSYIQVQVSLASASKANPPAHGNELNCNIKINSYVLF